jgi:hypothetical protein
VGFEPTIAVLERAKTVRALDRSTTAIGLSQLLVENIMPCQILFVVLYRTLLHKDYNFINMKKRESRISVDVVTFSKRRTIFFYL